MRHTATPIARPHLCSEAQGLAEGGEAGGGPGHQARRGSAGALLRPRAHGAALSSSGGRGGHGCKEGERGERRCPSTPPHLRPFFLAPRLSGTPGRPVARPCAHANHPDTPIPSPRPLHAPPRSPSSACRMLAGAAALASPACGPWHHPRAKQQARSPPRHQQQQQLRRQAGAPPPLPPLRATAPSPEVAGYETDNDGQTVEQRLETVKTMVATSDISAPYDRCVPVPGRSSWQGDPEARVHCTGRMQRAGLRAAPGWLHGKACHRLSRCSPLPVEPPPPHRHRHAAAPHAAGAL